MITATEVACSNVDWPTAVMVMSLVAVAGTSIWAFCRYVIGKK